MWTSEAEDGRGLFSRPRGSKRGDLVFSRTVSEETHAPALLAKARREAQIDSYRRFIDDQSPRAALDMSKKKAQPSRRSFPARQYSFYVYTAPVQFHFVIVFYCLASRKTRLPLGREQIYLRHDEAAVSSMLHAVCVFIRLFDGHCSCLAGIGDPCCSVTKQCTDASPLL